MAANFFSDALRQAMASRHFNQAQLAEFLGVDPAYVSRWLKGSSPRLDQMRTVLTALGWEIMRGRPDYDPFEDAIGRLKEKSAEPGTKVREKSSDYASMEDVRKLLQGAAESHKRTCHPPVVLAGRVLASKGQVQFTESKHPEMYEGLGSLFPIPNYADNELSMLVVEGNELQPVHPDGSRLLIRRVLKLSSVPEGTEVLMEPSRKEGTFHLRRFVRIAEKGDQRIERIIGAPLVPSQEYLFFKPREVRVSYAVVGTLTTVTA